MRTGATRTISMEFTEDEAAMLALIVDEYHQRETKLGQTDPRHGGDISCTVAEEFITSMKMHGVTWVRQT